MSWTTMVKAYEKHQQARGLAAGTIRLHRYRLMDLEASVRGGPASVTTDHLIEMLATPGWKPNTRKSVRTAYRSFFRWAHRSGRLDVDPAMHLEPVRVPPAPAKPAPELVVRRTLRDADPRERFMVMLGAYAGLRCCEISQLHADWWDGRNLWVLGKGGKTRRVPVRVPDLVELLDALDGVAFPNRWTGRPLTAGHVSVLLSQALSETWTGHTLRHRYGTVAVEATKDIHATAEMMGHASIATTQRYCKVSEDRLVAIAQAVA